MPVAGDCCACKAIEAATASMAIVATDLLAGVVVVKSPAQVGRQAHIEAQNVVRVLQDVDEAFVSSHGEATKQSGCPEEDAGSGLNPQERLYWSQF